jgi:hypothetical protein
LFLSARHNSQEPVALSSASISYVKNNSSRLSKAEIEQPSSEVMPAGAGFVAF